MKYYLQRLGILVRRFWPMMFALTIYQVSVYVGLTVLLAMKQWRVHLEDDFFKVYLLAYIVMSLPLCVMQYSPNVYSPRNSNDLETLVNFIFAQTMMTIYTIILLAIILHKINITYDDIFDSGEAEEGIKYQKLNVLIAIASLLAFAFLPQVAWMIYLGRTYIPRFSIIRGEYLVPESEFFVKN